MDSSQLIDRALDMSRTLSYNDEKEAPIKHMMRELAWRLGDKTIEVKKIDNRLTIITPFGRNRLMTFGERVLYRLFKVIPPIEGSWRTLNLK